MTQARHGEWTVRVEHSASFVTDEIRLTVAQRGLDRTSIVLPIPPLAMRALDPHGAVPDPPIEPTVTLPDALGRALLDALVAFYVGSDANNVMAKIRHLEREKDKALSQLDALIAGIGRLAPQ